MIDAPIAVSSRTFSRHKILKAELSQHFSDIRFNDEGKALKGEELVSFLRGRKGAIIALEPISAAVIENLPELDCISKFGVGLDNLDQEAMKRSNVALGWSGGVNRRSVSELALSFALGMYRNVFQSSRLLANREWLNRGGRQISEKTVGIIGAGFVGEDTARLFKAFNCKILLNDIVDKSKLAAEIGAEIAEKEQIFESPVSISHRTPLTDETENLINKDVLQKMKTSAVLVNTARGNIVHELDLLWALKEKQIAAAAMDVFATEPPLDSELLGLDNFFGTPHIGGSSQEAILNMGRAAIENLRQHF